MFSVVVLFCRLFPISVCWCCVSMGCETFRICMSYGQAGLCSGQSITNITTITLVISQDSHHMGCDGT